MSTKVCDIILGMIIFSLIFNTIPQILRLNFLGGSLAGQLTLYPLLIGMIYTIYCQWRYRNIFIYWDAFCKFIWLYVGVTLVSTIWGLYTYPYYDIVLLGPTNQITKLPYVLDFLHNHGIWANEKYLTITWMMMRTLKLLFVDALYTLGGHI